MYWIFLTFWLNNLPLTWKLFHLKAIKWIKCAKSCTATLDIIFLLYWHMLLFIKPIIFKTENKIIKTQYIKNYGWKVLENLIHKCYPHLGGIFMGVHNDLAQINSMTTIQYMVLWIELLELNYQDTVSL